MSKNRHRNHIVAQWIVITIAIGTLIFNSGILYNDVKHLKAAVDKLNQEVTAVRNYLLDHK